MKLYYSPGACSLAVRILINELDIACDYESVNLKTKQTETGANFLEINPKGYVPTLKLDTGMILTENCIIHLYLAETHKATTLLPDDFNRYRILEWLNFISTELHKACGVLFNPELPESIKDEFFKPLLRKKINLVNEHLSKNIFINGENFSLADGYLFVILNWLRIFHMELADWSHCARYFGNLLTRPSVKQSLQAEGLWQRFETD